MNPSRYLLLGLCCLASACAGISTSSAPTLDKSIPLEWTDDVNAGALESGEIAPPLWRRFDDPALAELIDLALAANLDLAILSSRVLEARFLRQADVASLGPRVDIGASAGMQRLSENGIIPFGRIEGLESDSYLFDASLDASWELDLFGRGKALRSLSEARIVSAEQDLDDARLTLIADLTRNYLDLQSLRIEAQLLEEMIASRSRLLDYTRARRAAGVVTDTDVEHQEMILSDLSARRGSLTSEVKATLVSLAILTGQSPATLESELPAETPPPPVTLLAGVRFTSEHLRLRPDVRRAEQTYIIAARREDLATLDLYPRVTLLGSVGPESTELANFLDPASLAANASALLSWALFDNGRRGALKDAATEARSQAELSYRQVVLKAMGEVENSATNLDAALQLHADRSVAAGLSGSLMRMTTARYQGGTATRLDVEEARNNELDSRIAALRAARQAVAAAIAFEKAVGTELGHSYDDARLSGDTEFVNPPMPAPSPKA